MQVFLWCNVCRQTLLSAETAHWLMLVCCTRHRRDLFEIRHPDFHSSHRNLIDQRYCSNTGHTHPCLSVSFWVFLRSPSSSELALTPHSNQHFIILFFSVSPPHVQLPLDPSFQLCTCYSLSHSYGVFAVTQVASCSTLLWGSETGCNKKQAKQKWSLRVQQWYARGVLAVCTTYIVPIH